MLGGIECGASRSIIRTDAVKHEQRLWQPSRVLTQHNLLSILKKVTY
jgi:hypothetical protein